MNLRETRILILATASILAGTPVAVFPASSDYPKYRIIDVGDFGWRGLVQDGALNASGQVTGTADAGPGRGQQAFLWRGDGTPMVELTSDPAIQSSSGAALNNAGQVTGIAYDANNNIKAFLWKNDGSPMGLGTLGADAVSQGNAINDAGLVVGFSPPANASWNAPHAFVWNGTTMLDLGTLGGQISSARDINSAGWVTGDAETAKGFRHAYIWKNKSSGLVDLGTLGGKVSYGESINASGQIAGESMIWRQTTLHAFLWRNDGTPMVNLGALGPNFPDSRSVKLNNSGQVIGVATDASDTLYRAFIWRNDGSRILDLGTLGGTYSYAWGLNAFGWVTGWAYLIGDTNYHAFLWKNNGQPMQDLNDLIDPKDPLKPYVVITSGDAINDAGDIMATGNYLPFGAQHAFLLRGSLLTVNPRKLAIGNQKVGTVSAAQMVTVYNTSTSPVPITSVDLAGSGAAQFSYSSHCGTSVVSKGTCSIALKFKPTAKGSKSATLSINGGGGGLRVVTLTGTGT